MSDSLIIYLHLYLLQFFAYIFGAIWAIQHLTVTLTFKDYWSHDLHDLAERRLTFITILIFTPPKGSRSQPFGHAAINSALPLSSNHRLLVDNLNFAG